MLQGFGTIETPPPVAAALREIDPEAVLHHLGGPQWLLGVQKPTANAHAKAIVERQMRSIVTTPNEVSDVADRARVDFEMAHELAVLQLCATGFRPIHLYDQHEYTFAEIVSDFRERDWNWRHRPEQAFRAFADSLNFDELDQRRTRTVREFVEQEAGSLWRHCFAQAKGFVQSINPLSRSRGATP